MPKTNKAAAKRIKLTVRGKALRRPQHQNHFKAKEPRSKQLGKKGWTSVSLSKRTIAKYLPLR